jgi:hypothetical protein
MADRSWPKPPREAEKLVGCMGVAATFALLELRGGTRLYVPKSDNIRSSWMLEKLGETALLRLAQSYGGAEVVLPLCRTWRVMVYLQRSTMSYAEIALMVGASEDMVQRLSPLDRVALCRSTGRISGKLPTRAKQRALASAKGNRHDLASVEVSNSGKMP